MADSAAERPVLNEEQKLELNYLKLTWDRFYALSTDGMRWFAVPCGTGTVLHAGSKTEMHKVLLADAASRSSQRGHFIDAASGPPAWVGHRMHREQDEQPC